MAEDMKPRVAVVTGASAGIGKEAAKALAAQGWSVIGIGRDPGRTAEAATELRAAANGAPVHMIQADLALMADARRAADEIASLTDRIHVLLNNAGGVAREKVITAEGLEANFAGNHLGPFLLTERLTPLLRRAAADAPAGAVRIINTSSDGSEMIPGLNWDDLQLLEQFIPGRAYCQGKLANVLHARGLAGRLANDGIVAHAVHPGTIASNFASHAPEDMQAHMAGLDSKTSEWGAEALIWLATAPEPGQSTGGYFHQRTPAPPNPFVQDDNVERLWRESERLIDQAGG